MNEMSLNQTDVQLDDIIVSIIQLDYGMNVCHDIYIAACCN